VPPLDHARVFHSLPDACLVLDRDLRMVDANPAFLALVGRRLDELVGGEVQDVFPVPDDDPDAAERVLDAYRRARATRRPYPLGVIRYDLPAADDPGRYEQRWFATTTAPVLDDDGEVTHLVGRAREVTAVRSALLAAVAAYREALPDGPEPGGSDALADLGVDTLDTAALAATLATELEQLREAMVSRATIEQAKGVLMAREGVGPDGAFDVLREQSQHANRKLRDVAAELVAEVGATGSALGC
jgi:PAS domain S-box-containing protein